MVECGDREGVIEMFVDLADGRRLEVMVAGPEDGVPLVYHYGTPSAAVPYPPTIDAAARRGLRTVVYSRPGYGESTAQPGRTVADAAADTAAVLDALGAGRFVTIGKSGGGPHALACAALLPDRCAAAASVAGVAPFPADGLDWLAGMGPENVEEFGAAVEGEEALTRYLRKQAEELATVQGGDVAQAFGDLVSDIDRRALTGEFAEFTAASFRRSVLHGVAGWRDDDLAFVRDWGFRPGDGTPVAIWQGGQDRMVPYAHGEWLAAHVPGARVHLLPDEGHMSLLIQVFDEVLADLLDQAGELVNRP
jgi:pimeloyl-ACP methyl ester carboxylesterase